MKKLDISKLYLSNNFITDEGVNIFQDLTSQFLINLSHLDISKNKITKINELKNVCETQSYLEYLYYEDEPIVFKKRNVSLFRNSENFKNIKDEVFDKLQHEANVIKNQKIKFVDDKLQQENKT